MLLAVRDHLVRTRGSFIVQARGLAKALGERLPKCQAETFANKMRREVGTDVFPAMDVIVTTVEQLDARSPGSTRSSRSSRAARTRRPSCSARFPGWA